MVKTCMSGPAQQALLSTGYDFADPSIEKVQHIYLSSLTETFLKSNRRQHLGCVDFGIHDGAFCAQHESSGCTGVIAITSYANTTGRH